jgi:iron complex outermembrane receptor protein
MQPSKALSAYLFASAGALALIAPGVALAQSAGGGAQLEEVVVTAQKRVQRLQDVPVSVTALPADTLVANRITNVRDLDAVVPNLTVRTIVGGSLLPNYTIRGLVSLGSALGSDKGVAVYIDGVYLGSAQGSQFDLADIERIEVLRGPQGTLFGRNSTGGAISITTPDPKGQFGLREKATVGNYRQFRSSTTLNTPQFGPFSANATYTHSERRGDIRNLGGGTTWDFTPDGIPKKFTSPKYLGGSNIDAVAAKVKFEPNDKLSMIYRFDWTKEDYTSTGQGVVYEQPLIKSIVAAQPNQALMTPISRTRPDAVNNAGAVPSSSKNFGHALTAVYQVTDHITVKNIAAYRYMEFFSPSQDFGAVGGLINTGAPVFASVLGAAVAASTVGAPLLIQATSTSGRDLQWSDELQLNIDTKFATVTSGLLYSEQKNVRAPFGTDTGIGRARSGGFRVYPGYLVPFAGQLAGTGGRGSRVYAFSRAAYAQGEFHLTHQLDVVAGARYTKDTKKGLDYSTVSAAPPIQPPTPLRFEAGKWTYNLGVNYKVTDDILTYGKYSTGYISGGSLAGLTYNPETAKSWEGGLKADWLGHTLRTNLSVFDVKYGSLQGTTSGTNLTPPLPLVTQAIITTGDAKAKGFEFEGTYLPIRQVTLTTGVGYTDFKFTRVSNIAKAGTSEYLVANRPKWTLALSGQYTSDPIWNDVKLTARVDGNWKSKSNGVATIPLGALNGGSAVFTPSELAIFKAAQRIDAYWLVNGRVALTGFRIGGADATVALWGRNILNNKSVSYSPSLVTVITANYEAARTFGLDLDVNF